MLYKISNHNHFKIKSVNSTPGPDRAIGFLNQLAKKVQAIDTKFNKAQDVKIRKVILEIQSKCKNKHPWLYTLQSIFNPFSSAYKIDNLLCKIISGLDDLSKHPKYSTCEIALAARYGSFEDNEFIGAWKSHEGTALISPGQTELCLKFIISHVSESLKAAMNEFHFFLPAKLFTDKKEGDILILQYKDELVKLKINQLAAYNSGRTKDYFENLLEDTKNYSLKLLKNGYLGFEESQIFKEEKEYESGYTLVHEGSLYKFDSQNNMFGPSNSELPMWDTIEINKTEYDVEDMVNHKRIRFSMCGVKDLNIGINSKYIFFSGEKMNWHKELTYGNVIFLAWNRLFPENTLEQIKEKILRAKISKYEGIFTIEIPI